VTTPAELNEQDHAFLVSRLVKPGEEIADDLNNKTGNHRTLMNCVRNMTEVSNQLDSVKKIAIYNKPNSWRLSGGAIPRPITAEQAHLLHMAIGIVGEAGEILEAVVAHIDGQELDMENCVEELGDLEFYMEGFRASLGITRNGTLSENITKLTKRYGEKYSDEAAQNRADKAHNPKTKG
jgi:NTP pyrophosphatase (non-canonical NTP hydrolase)